MSDIDETNWRELSRRCLQLAFEGRPESAIECGERALELAATEVGRVHGEFAECLKNLACAHLSAGDADTAIAMLIDAVSIAESAADRAGDDGDRLAEIVHRLGAAYHAAEKLPDAESHYRRALRLREKSLGDSHPLLAKSLGDLARLLADTGREFDAIDPLILRARELLTALLTDAGEREPHSQADADRLAEAAIDLANLANNRGVLLLRAQRPADAESELLAALEWMEDFRARGGRLDENLVVNSMRNLRAAIAAQGRDVGEGSAFVEELIPRADALLSPSAEDAVTFEREFWAELTRQLLAARDRENLTDAELGLVLREMFQTRELPSIFAEPEILPELMHGFAERVFRSTLVVMVPMSIELLIAGNQSLEETFANLAELGVGYLIEAIHGSAIGNDDGDEIGDDFADDSGEIDESELP